MNFNVKIEGPINGLKHTDFVIVSESGKEIPCHKFVLAMKSTVFEAMLDMQDSKEVLTGRVQINDASDEALEMMVSYIYNTDIQIQDEDIYQDLLVLSNKYNWQVHVRDLHEQVGQAVSCPYCNKTCKTQ